MDIKITCQYLFRSANNEILQHMGYEAETFDVVGTNIRYYIKDYETELFSMNSDYHIPCIDLSGSESLRKQLENALSADCEISIYHGGFFPGLTAALVKYLTHGLTEIDNIHIGTL